VVEIKVVTTRVEEVGERILEMNCHSKTRHGNMTKE
jgi:hypothetical protein